MSETLSANIVKPKRRRNRKKKSKAGKADGSDGATVNGSTSSTAENTYDQSETSEVLTQDAIDETERMMVGLTSLAVSNQDILRKSLVSMGFTVEEIDEAVMEMWDKELPYDEYEAVLKYLESSVYGGEMEVKVNVSQDITVETDEGEDTEDSTNTDQAADSLEYGELENEDIAVVHPGRQQETVEEDSDDEGYATPTAPALTMADKLDMVAGFENLTDSIFALTQWVNNAARSDEIECLCLAAKTRALPTVIRRGITECKEKTKFDNAVLPGLVRLLFSLFKRCGIEHDPAQAESAERSMEALLGQARKVTLLKPEDDSDYSRNEIAEMVARFVVSRLAVAMDEAKLAGSLSPNVSFHNATTSSKSLSSEGALIDRVSKRQKLKVELQRASIEAQSSLDIALGNVVNNSSAMLNGSADQNTHGEVDALLSALIDQESLDNQKSRLEELDAKVEDFENEKLQVLRAAVNSAEGERLAVQEKIAELKSTLERLATQDEELACRIGSLETEIVNEERIASDIAKQLAEETREAKDAVKFGNSVANLAEMLKSYSKSLESAVHRHIKAAVDGSKQADHMAVKKMDVYLRQVRSYMMSEAQYAGQLLTQLDSNRKGVATLKAELELCAALALTTTTDHIEKSIAAKQVSIDDESKALDSVSKDAAAIFDELISRLEQYTGAAKKESWNLQSAQSIIIFDVVGAVKKLDIGNWERLLLFLPEGSPAHAGKEKIQPAMSEEKSAANVAVPASANSSMKMPVEHIAAPKLTWASGGKPSAAAPKTSLLDIQKQELELRSDS